MGVGAAGARVFQRRRARARVGRPGEAQASLPTPTRVPSTKRAAKAHTPRGSPAASRSCAAPRAAAACGAAPQAPQPPGSKPIMWEGGHRAQRAGFRGRRALGSAAQRLAGCLAGWPAAPPPHVQASHRQQRHSTDDSGNGDHHHVGRAKPGVGGRAGGALGVAPRRAPRALQEVLAIRLVAARPQAGGVALVHVVRWQRQGSGAGGWVEGARSGGHGGRARVQGDTRSGHARSAPPPPKRPP